MKNYKGKPQIRKLGTIDCDMVETTPIVINGRLYRFEYVRDNYKPNKTGKSYFRFKGVETNAVSAPFAEGYHFGSAYNDNGIIYVFGVPKIGGEIMTVFRSKDLVNWEQKDIFNLPGWRLFNNSVCAGRDGFIMAFEIGDPPDECGHPFTIRFAKSADLWDWALTPSDCVYSKDRYTACPYIRYVPDDGNYYMIYLESLPGWGYVPYIARSEDLVKWQRSPVNPVLMFEEQEDKKLSNHFFSPEERARIDDALDVNNSDVDLCEFLGRTVIYYSWGNQTGVEFLAEAVYEGPVDEFLQGFFEEWEGGVHC
jgi:hypothetical protein